MLNIQTVQPEHNPLPLHLPSFKINKKRGKKRLMKCLGRSNLAQTGSCQIDTLIET